MNNTKTFILYHANCFDGTGAKYAAWKKYHSRATYIPVQYGKPFPEKVPLEKTTEIFILDFSYSKEILLDISSKVGSIVVLDHHKTAEEDLRDLPFAKFDMEKSGAVMAWEYFHPGQPVPALLQHIQDGDLWKFKIPNTEAVRCALPLLEGDLSKIDYYASYEEGLRSLIDKGNTILASNIIKINSVVKNNVKVLPYKGLKAGVCNTSTLTSEIGNSIYASDKLDVDFSLTYFFDRDGVPFVSFRSKEDIDVSVLAKELGGGGHKNAAGAKVTMKFIEDLYNGLL